MSHANAFQRDHIIVIDPGVKAPEVDCFNYLAMQSPLPLTYHMPALFGSESLVGAQQTAVEAGYAKGIIILGSASSVNERLPWQVSLESWLLPVLQREVPTFGICYGHQMLAHMFGGRVDYMFPDQRKFVGFRQMNLSKDGWWTNLPSAGSIAVTHNEAVLELPPEMAVVGTSPEVRIDALAHKNLPIWGVQSHPEATEAFLIHSCIDTSKSIETLSFGKDLMSSFLRFAATKK